MYINLTINTLSWFNVHVYWYREILW
jgi:hypothetical protein